MVELMQRLDAGMVFTLNPDHLYHLQRNPAFFSAYRKADFITSDSKYVYWSLGWIGRRIREKVSGSDIVPTFCHYHRDNPDVKVFLLGAAPGIAQKARERINRREGSQVVVGAHGPSMNFVKDPAEIADVIQMINDSGATVLIVGLGAPKQEIWMDRYRSAMPKVKVFMGVGATIDYEADAVVRAPRWMTRNGLEWVYRITTEPKRYWRRYLRDMDSSGSSSSMAWACIGRPPFARTTHDQDRHGRAGQDGAVPSGDRPCSSRHRSRRRMRCHCLPHRHPAQARRPQVLRRLRPHARERAARCNRRRDAVEAACADGSQGA
jgi:exopolysaccharide biosynthesis WecB/TagA/CpsF family protein